MASQARGKRHKYKAQLPGVLPHALEAARHVAKVKGWETVSREIGRRERRHPDFKGGWSPKTIRNLMRNNGAKMTYSQLELFAGVFGIPSGVLLDVSHVMSCLRQGTAADNEKARQYAKGLRALANAITKETNGTAKLDLATQIRGMEKLYAVWKKKGLDVTMPLKKKT